MNRINKEPVFIYIVMKRYPFGMVFLILLALFGSCRPDRPTEVLVLGTIHARHAENPNYQYADVMHIIQSYKPEVICVEIRSEDYRKKPYLKEMDLAALFGICNSIPVYPIDWWEQGVREERNKYAETVDYKKKEGILDSLMQTSPVIQDFEKTYGTRPVANQNKDFQWFNGRQFNDYYAEYYRLSMQVYGDHCVNLYYKSRNDSMLKRIEEVLFKHPGEKILILTGAEHKHYFDNALLRNPNVRLRVLQDMSIISRPIQQEAVRDFLEYGDPGLFLPDISQAERFRFIKRKLNPLVHGTDMDFDPYIVPTENIEKAAEILEYMGTEYSHLPGYAFEKGWLCFLQSDYAKAIQYMDTVIMDSSRVDPGGSWYILPASCRVQGFCFDMLGQRARAVNKYRQARKISEGFDNFPAALRPVLFDPWIENPYTHSPL